MREFGKRSKHSNKLKNRVMWLLTTSIVWQKNAWTLFEWNRFKQTTVVAQLRRICFCSDVSHRLEPVSLSFSFKIIYSCLKLEIERTVERITPQWRSGTFSWCPSWLAWTAWSQKQTHLSRQLKADQRGKLSFTCWTKVFYKNSN